MQNIPYARRAMNREKSAWVDIKVDHMRLADALYWDATIQRDIRAAAGRGKASKGARRRADVHWSWAGMRLFLPLAQHLNNRRCRALTVFVQDDQARAVPAGMLLLIERYPWPLAGDVTQSTFTWFIASAPTASLLKRGVAGPPSLGRIMVDAALVTSQALGLQGRMWLHAAPAGGPGLLNFYARICQMEALPLGNKLPNGKMSDGRHFYATASLANRLINALQLTR